MAAPSPPSLRWPSRSKASGPTSSSPPASLLSSIGSASLNPITTTTFYVVGIGSDSLFSMALQFLAQEKIKEARNTQQATQDNCSLQPILTEVLGDNKGKYVHRKGNHTKKKDAATSAGRYEMETLNELIKQNQELRHTFRDEVDAPEQSRDAQFREEMSSY